MKKQKILILIILISSFMVTIGYSSFSKNLGIEDLTAIVRDQTDIRITGISVNKVTNDAISTYEEYDRDNISIGIELPNDTSTITYNIEIFNYGNVYNILSKIEGLPSNLEYTISDYEEGTIICNIANICNLGIGRDIKLTIKYKNNTNTTTQTEYPLNLSFIFEKAQTEFTFDYTGDYQTFTVPYDGNYKIELWGAQGGNASSYSGGLGAYTSGNIELSSGDIMYLYVGGQGLNSGEFVSNTATNYNNSPEAMQHYEYSKNGYYTWGNKYYKSSTSAFNNGSYATQFNTAIGASGGGATDIRLITDGTWDSFDSLKSRIMVAASGSGGSSYHKPYFGLPAGGLNGYDAVCSSSSVSAATSGSQTFGGISGGGIHANNYTSGTFGKAGAADYSVASGGNGYYGGGAGCHCSGIVGSAATGSSFISGHEGSDAISEESIEDNIIHTGQSIHYSGYQFTNTVMIDGAGYQWTTEKGTEVVGMPTHDGKSTMIGNTGNGYAKITYLGMEMNTNYEFDYTGDEQIFIVPEDGYYKLETWGASGGFSKDENVLGGYGGYSNGKIYLNARDVIYINIGGKGIDGTTTTDNKKGGYNGGGDSYYFSHANCYSGSGGGATHIATKSGLLFTLEDYQENILIVSGGGGGASGDYTSSMPGSSFGGSGGGIKGADSYNIVGTMNSGPGYGGTQTSGGNFYQSEYSGQIGSFGKGADSTSGTNKGGPGAGGGYYGGGSGGGHFGSGGGSGYIGNERLYDKVMYCYNCQESSEESTKTISTTNVSEEPMSGYAKKGNGYARITYIKQDHTAPSMDVRTEVIDGVTYAYVDTEDDTEVKYVTDGISKVKPNTTRPEKKILFLSHDDTRYYLHNYITDYDMDINPSNLTIDDIKKYDLIIYDGHAWRAPTSLNTYFNYGINIISSGNDTNSLNIIKKHTGINGYTTLGTLDKVSNTILAKNIKVYNRIVNDNQNSIIFKDDVEILYTTSYNNNVCHEIGYYNNNGTRWLHFQASVIFNVQYLADFIFGVNQARFKITSSGDYTFKTCDTSNNCSSKTIHIDIE